MRMIYRMAKLSEQVVFKAPREWVEKLEAVALRDRRTISAVERAIFERGYLAWLRDGRLFEPAEVKQEGTTPKLKALRDEGKKERKRA